VMRAIGARSYTIQRNVITESLLIGLMSWGLAIALSLPLSLLVGRLVGGLAFGLPLPLVVSPVALLVWLIFIGVGSILASLYPAKSAARLTIRETLAYV
jgi:putative ABC transport system permease protein